ncbi:hypothetical protein EZV62_020775 [Acer yangbiense]|uniref:Protein kinase domain-containing protein n=1 Tax=Acer yangbiense TaxID=1000413 RepID=A0A5C7HFA6_9ROSI|nr:hypothetical protein EZV62_020775 [Acer yangbiense]
MSKLKGYLARPSNSTGYCICSDTSPNLKVFTFKELKAATKNFIPDLMIGEGSFGRVYKGWLDGLITHKPSKAGAGIAVAVEKRKPHHKKGFHSWQAEVEFFGKFSHPHLVTFLGYCRENNEFLLVHEYIQKGSLENHLFRREREPLPWHVRLRIAIDAAKGLTFLHSREKSGSYNAKLSDFGLVKYPCFYPCWQEGNCITIEGMSPNVGVAPEYCSTGLINTKSDVYGFGVFLLEMLMGLRADVINCPGGDLHKWAVPFLSDPRKLMKQIIDPKLEKTYPLKAAIQLAGLIIKCLQSNCRDRPSIDQVLKSLEEIMRWRRETLKPLSNSKARAAHNPSKELLCTYV